MHKQLVFNIGVASIKCRTEDLSWGKLCLVNLLLPDTFQLLQLNDLEVFSLTDPHLNWLLQIEEAAFFLRNPYSESFLTYMDIEKQSNWSIWLIRNQIMGFATDLLRTSERRVSLSLSKITLGFFEADDPQRCSLTSEESLSSYYNGVVRDLRTNLIDKEDDLKSIEKEHSLFKSNAVLNPSEISADWVEKFCGSEIGDNAERLWLSCAGRRTSNCEYFDPVGLTKRISRNMPRDVSCTHRLNGVTAAELLWHIQQIGRRYPEFTSKLQILAGSLVFQAFRALSEFYDIAHTAQEIKSQFRVYPWSQQLTKAILEGGRFVTYEQHKLHKCLEEIQEMGCILEENAKQPFRDAHLKNRLVVVDKKLLSNGYEGFCEWLDEMDQDLIFAWLKKSTYDVDFETSLWLVSKWDDPLHILWSSNIGINQAKELRDGLDLLKIWWEVPQNTSEESVLWMTLLCRSLREYCRRLWYSHTMPNTYNHRYEIEERDHFLLLSLAATSHIEGYDAVKSFLYKSRQLGDAVWNSVYQRENPEPIVAVNPPNVV